MFQSYALYIAAFLMVVGLWILFNIYGAIQNNTAKLHSIDDKLDSIDDKLGKLYLIYDELGTISRLLILMKGNTFDGDGS